MMVVVVAAPAAVCGVPLRAVRCARAVVLV